MALQASRLGGGFIVAGRGVVVEAMRRGRSISDPSRAIGLQMDTFDDDLTDDHMRLLLWLDAHPTGSLAAAAQALELAVTDVERLCADLVAAEMIERAPMQ